MNISTKKGIEIFACAIVLVFCFAAKSFSADVIKLKYASFMPPVHPHSILSDQWCKELEKRTNGKVQVSYYPAGTLVNANQMYDGVVKGIIDIGWSR